MRIKLILAASKSDPMRKNDPFMPLSLPLLAASAPNHDYTLVDMLWEDISNTNDKVDLVGISARHTAEKTAYKLADSYRSRNIPVILGGAQISMMPYEAKQHADAVVIGEAENLWPVILADLQNNNLKSFYVCSPEPFDGHNEQVFQLPSLPDLSNIAPPLRSLYKKHYSFDTVFASRGCPIGCDFCCVSKIFGTKERLRPAEQVVSEIDSFKNYYYLLDDTVFGRPKTYDYYLNLYKRIAKLRKRRFWIGQGNIDAAANEAGRDVIRAAADSGLIYAALGMESINPAVLSSSGALSKMGAGSNIVLLDQLHKNLDFIQSQGIFTSGWFVVGYDDDDLGTYQSTLDFCDAAGLVPVIMPVYALPGTKLYNKAQSENRLDNSRFINFRNARMPQDKVIPLVKDIMTRGYSWQRCIDRTLRFLKTTRGKSVNTRIHTAIFSLILQRKMRPGMEMWKPFESGELL